MLYRLPLLHWAGRFVTTVAFLRALAGFSKGVLAILLELVLVVRNSCERWWGAGGCNKQSYYIFCGERVVYQVFLWNKSEFSGAPDRLSLLTMNACGTGWATVQDHQPGEVPKLLRQDDVHATGRSSARTRGIEPRQGHRGMLKGIVYHGRTYVEGHVSEVR